MLEFQQREDCDTRLYMEDTDATLPEVLNPKTRYAFFSAIATGGKSLIKSCRDLHLKRTVCYKTLRPEFIDNPIENQRLLREARISALLQHPNTIPTYELGRDSRGNYYFTMKLVHGYTLREVLNYRERYDLGQLMDVIIQVGRALAYAHSRGVLHRDVKPENVLVGPYGETLVLDWGLAKVWPKSTDTEDLEADIDEVESDPGMTGEDKLQGTVMYMSPEQIHRDPKISFQSDIYSLGSVLFETLTGRTPFQGEVVRSVIEQVKNEPAPDPRSVTKERIPDVLAELTMQCLQKDPNMRCESIDDMIRIIREAC